MLGRSIFIVFIVIFLLVFTAVDKLALFAEENELQSLCNQLPVFDER